MAILDATAQEIVSMTRSECARWGGVARAAAGVGGSQPDNTAANIAEAVMGSEAWNTYKNSAYKSMKGPHKPEGDVAMKKRVKERTLKLGGSLAGWTMKLGGSLANTDGTFRGYRHPLDYGSTADVDAARRRREQRTFGDTGKRDFRSLLPAQGEKSQQAQIPEVIDGR